MRIALTIAFSIACLVAKSATWYASATGSATNGTSISPWSVPYSVTNGNPHLQPGDTVLFKDGGTFTCTETNITWSMAKELEFRVSGTPGSKITYRPESLWGFTFNGGLLFPTSVSNVVIRDFRITYLGSTNRTMSNATVQDIPAGINTYARGVDIMHNLIENTGHPGIGSWASTAGKYIAGNVIRFVGMDDTTPAYGGNPRGSGMYMQNVATNTAEALIQGNISYHNYTTGMKAYGNSDSWGFTFRNQIVADCNEAGLFYHQDNSPSTNLVMDSNYLWNNGVGLRVGYPSGNGGHSNAVLVSNYVVEDDAVPFYQVDGWTRNTWTNNVGVRLTQRYLWQMEVLGETSGNIASHTIDYNTYYSENSGGVGAGPFPINETARDFATWKTMTGGDANSTWQYGVPTGLVVKAFAPSTDNRFVHVAVYNWNTNASASVNLGTWFASGDSIKVFDAQDLPNAYTNFTYTGGSVSLSLTRTNVATMLGDFTQGRGVFTGFDPRFRAFVLFKDGTNAISSSPRSGSANSANAGTINKI